MRLYDKLLATPGGATDQVMSGALSALCLRLREAQCFILSEDISQACLSIYQSKPSSIVAATPLIRTPYPKTWIEWQPSNRPKLRDNFKQQPQRVGALLDTNETCDRGIMYLVWSHNMKDELDITLNPLGVIFNWGPDDTPVIKSYAQAIGLNDVINPDELIARRVKYVEKWHNNSARWSKHNIDDTERKAALALDLRTHIIPHPSCYDYIQQYKCFPSTTYGESLIDDLAGELPFLESFLLLLNSRNTIVDRKKEDLSKLNRARARNRRPPLKEFIVTSIRLNKVQTNRINAEGGGTREAAIRHLVRGHFKLRKSGVYWWSPHIRGFGNEKPRQEYRVQGSKS